MPNLNAALVLAQLEQLEEILKDKKSLFDAYHSELSNQGMNLITPPKTTSHWNYWLMSVIMNDRKERDQFLKVTNENGVMTRPIWSLIHTLPMYQGSYVDKQTNAKYFIDRIVNIPSSARIK
jgi:dTDP-4-amino-4,6-dideoxygalactose transaminase